MPNHFQFLSRNRMVAGFGQLVKDGYGWYKKKEKSHGNDNKKRKNAAQDPGGQEKKG